MPVPDMSREERKAYAEAQWRIVACRHRLRTSLDLSQLGLSVLPSEIGQLSALTELDISRNQLTALPPEIGQLSALRELYLRKNQLTALPPEIGQLSALRGLYLHSNQLTSLPPEIGQLSALKVLNLAYNQLRALPPEIGQLSAGLTRLDLAANPLTALPPEIGQLSALRELYLSNNPLTALPPEIGQLSALKVLRISGIKLRALPPEIGQLRLERLFLHGNPGLGIPDGVLGPTFVEVYRSKKKPAARPGDILAFYFERQQVDLRRVGEIKLMLVGRGGAGERGRRVCGASSWGSHMTRTRSRRRGSRWMISR